MSAPVESAAALSEVQVTKTSLLETHLGRMAATYQCKAWFKWQGDPSYFGLLSLEVDEYTQGNRFATLPLFFGDDVKVLRNGGFIFADKQTWKSLDNMLVKFECTLQVVPPGRVPTTVFTFWTPASGTGSTDVLVATINLANGPNSWAGTSGYTTFFSSPLA